MACQLGCVYLLGLTRGSVFVCRFVRRYPCLWRCRLGCEMMSVCVLEFGLAMGLMWMRVCLLQKGWACPLCLAERCWWCLPLP